MSFLCLKEFFYLIPIFTARSIGDLQIALDNKRMNSYELIETLAIAEVLRSYPV